MCAVRAFAHIRAGVHLVVVKGSGIELYGSPHTPCAGCYMADGGESFYFRGKSPKIGGVLC